MISPHCQTNDTEVSGSGWVGVTDSLVGVMVLLLVITLASLSQLNTANNNLKNTKLDLNELEIKLDLLIKQLAYMDSLSSSSFANYENYIFTLRNQIANKDNIIANLRKADEEVGTAKKIINDLKKEHAQITARLNEAENSKIKLRINESQLMAKLLKLNENLATAEQIKEQILKEVKENKEHVLKLVNELNAKNTELIKNQLENESLKLKADIFNLILKDFNSTEKEILTSIKEFKKNQFVYETTVKGLRLELENLKEKAKISDDIFGEFNLKPNDISSELRKLNRDLKDTFGELRIAKKELDDLHRKQEHAKLLGIKGDLKMVAMVVDFSGSMDYPLDEYEESNNILNQNDTKPKSRWEITKEMISTFCELLDMEQCVLILFNNNVFVYDRNAALDKKKIIFITDDNNDKLGINENLIKQIAPFRLRANQSDRSLLKGIANNLGKPSGGTNTLKALSTAYQLSPGSIILFTDGAPGLETPPEQSKEQKLRGEFPKPPDFDVYRNLIYELIKNHKNGPPINVIGIGYYFDSELSRFLKTLAKQTNGSFQGR